MDFVIGLPLTKGIKNSIWVVVDKLTKSPRFILTKDSWSLKQLTKAYVGNIVKLHRVPKEVVSDCDPSFTSHFWKRIQTAFRTILK